MRIRNHTGSARSNELVLHRRHNLLRPGPYRAGSQSLRYLSNGQTQNTVTSYRKAKYAPLW